MGRVGALAVGLGVGAALASMPAIAFADTTGSAGSTASASSSTSAAGGVSSGAGASSSGTGASPSGQESSQSSGLSGEQDSSSGDSPAGSDVDASDVDASEVDASEVDGLDVDASEVDASGADASEVDASGVDASEVDSSEVVGLDVGSSGAGSSGAYASGAGSSGIDASDVDASGIDVSDMGADGDTSDFDADFDAAMSDFDAADESAADPSGSDSSTAADAGGASPSVPAVAAAASAPDEVQISEEVAIDRLSGSGLGEQDSSNGLDIPAAALGLATLGFASRREASSRAATGASQEAVAELADPADANVLVIAIDGVRLSAILEDPANVNLFALMAGGDIVTSSGATAIVGGTTAASTIVGHSTISLPSYTAIMNGVWGETAGVINNVYYPETADNYPTVFNTLETTFGDNIQTMSIANWVGTAAISDAESLGTPGADVVQYVEGFENDPMWTQRDDRVGELTVQAIEGTNPGCGGPCPVPDFLFSYLGGVDETGHEFGGGSPEYDEALRNTDEIVGEIMEAVVASGEDWTVLVTTDHGQSTTRGPIGVIAHGFQDPEETTTFVIAWDGKNLTPIFEPGAMNNQYSIVDVSPTVLDIFGGPDLPPTWYEGVPLSDHDASTVKPVDPDGLRLALLDAIGMYGYPDLLTQASQAWRTITATIPYLVYETTNDIVSAVEGFLPSALSWLVTVPVQFIGDLLYTATNIPARIFAAITGVNTGIFPLLPPPVPSPPVAPAPPMSPNVLANSGAGLCVWSLSGTVGAASLSSSQTSSPTIGLNSRPTSLAANSC
ncbi:MAG: alkaline phosphatase family protein [Actinomycetia bacterium]|nr:alkaline phosphatase family protein [Actinomycetes bacterium]